MLGNQAELIRRVSAQALSKARQNLPFAVFNDLNDRLIQLAGQHIGMPRWQGLRVVAADASDVRLTARDATKRVIKHGKVFGLYLPGVEMTLHATLYGVGTGERQMLFEHLGHLGKDDLLVLDRGYPASWLMAALDQREIPYCMRIDNICGTVVKSFMRSGAAEAVVTLPAPEQAEVDDYNVPAAPVKVRLIRLVTPGALVRVVATNLLDAAQWPATDFGELYHLRWRIEEAFRRIKHRLDLEGVSGLSHLAHQQELAAKILADNLNAVLCLDALPLCNCDGQISDSAPTILKASPKVQLKINRTRAFARVRQCLPRWLAGAVMTVEELMKLLASIADNVVRFKPDRSYPRTKQPKPHKAFAGKPVM